MTRERSVFIGGIRGFWFMLLEGKQPERNRCDANRDARGWTLIRKALVVLPI